MCPISTVSLSCSYPEPAGLNGWTVLTEFWMLTLKSNDGKRKCWLFLSCSQDTRDKKVGYIIADTAVLLTPRCAVSSCKDLALCENFATHDDFCLCIFRNWITFYSLKIRVLRLLQSYHSYRKWAASFFRIRGRAGTALGQPWACGSGVRVEEEWFWVLPRLLRSLLCPSSSRFLHVLSSS